MTPPVAKLEEAGFALDPDRPLPFVQVEKNDRGHPVAPGETLRVLQGEASLELSLPSIGELLTGDAPTPDFSETPGDEFALFFAAIEGAIADYCSDTGRKERDKEIQRIYRRLRDRPDGTDRNPLFAHLRAALRLVLTLRPTSPAEYEAIMNRLATSARRLAAGKDSTHYLSAILRTLEELAEKEEAGESEDADPAEPQGD